ncbi:MAG: hypothetical protein AAFY64_07515 [Pseudomonadota bacterium]
MKTAFALIAALFLFGVAAAPANAQIAGLSQAKSAVAAETAPVQTIKWKKKHRRIAGAIALGVLGAVAAHHGYRYHAHRRRCARWLHRCNRFGSPRACYRYDTRC